MKKSKKEDVQVLSGSIIPKPSREKTSKKIDNNSYRMEILENFMNMVERGDVNDFIICGLSSDGQLLVASDCANTVVGTGILELTKQSFASSVGEFQEAE